MAHDVLIEFNKKNVLITGGLGFIGSNLAEALVKAGANVTILDALLAPYGGNTFNIESFKDKVTLINGNILDDELINETVAGQDYIFHLAGQVGYLDAKENPFLDLDFNGRGNLILLEAVKQHAPAAKILFSSSRLVYGKISSTPVTEAHPTEPLSLYGIHKLLGEKYYSYYAHNFNIHGVSVRIPNPYGPKQQMKHARYGIVGWFLRQAMEDKAIKIFGDGSQIRDYIYIDDIVSGLLHAVVRGKSGEEYNIGSNEGITFGQMAETILAEVGRGIKEYVPWPPDYEKNETGDYLADISKLMHDTAWQPVTNFVDGIANMHQFYASNRQHYW